MQIVALRSRFGFKKAGVIVAFGGGKYLRDTLLAFVPRFGMLLSTVDANEHITIALGRKAKLIPIATRPH
jgi:hypothetical protein